LGILEFFVFDYFFPTTFLQHIFSPKWYITDAAHSLKSRHVQFIALGGTIGTGLFIGIGKALAASGPLSILLGYSITGLILFAMMQSLVS